ncbi:MAG: hypothetical protein CMJ35_05650 [Phycisphaerae bacterium]|nr:hypothetical protein [Phycisphaerae bacterium]MBM91081.1 hypothetical protein [Phycisphaerae bacterium]
MTSTANRCTLIALTLLSTLALSGCIKQLVSNEPGGNMRSTDSFTYISTPFEPLTVTLYDFRDSEPLWTVDVPIGSKVTVRFLENQAKEGTTRRPDIMQWAIYDKDKRRTDLENKMAVPGSDARMLKVSIRDGVEYPDEEIEPVEFEDPSREWVPVEPRRFRGVPLDQNARQGSYISDD